MNSKVFILMGVAATGKTTLGQALAAATGGKFLDADDFHPESNRRKMATGEALDDADREGWLESIAGLIAEHSNDPTPTFIACSALKKSYRDLLRSTHPDLAFLFLTADPETLRERIAARHHTGTHFMPPSLLDSQLDTLELPANAFQLDVSKPVSELVDTVLREHPHLQS